MSEISEKARAIIAVKLKLKTTDVTETANFSDDLGADSLDFVELIMELEKEFNITIDSESMETLHTLEDVTSFIESAKSN